MENMSSETEMVEVVSVQKKRSKLRSISTVAGAILIHLTIGSIYSYGNLAPYFVSYIRLKGSPDLTYKESGWIFAITATGQGIFGGLGGLLEKKIGPRYTVLIGCLFVSGGVALTYITIDYGFHYLMITYGAMFGIGIGISYYVPLGCAMRWFPDRKGLIAGFVVGGFGGAAFIFNQISTAFINPNNLAPNLEINKDYFFTQPEVLDNVPKCMLLLAGVFVVMQSIGILLISNPPQDMTLEAVEKSIELSTIDKNIEEAADKNGVNGETVTVTDEKVPEKETCPDMTPLQMLKTKTFYHLWFMFFCENHVVTFISTLYKAYGLTFIRDDHFLSLVGAFSSICNAAGRILWGLLVDQTSFQIAQMCLTTCIACLYSLFAISEMGGRIVFFIFVCLIFLSFSGIYSSFPSITMKCFGSTYYASNFGFLCSAIAASNISASFLAQALKPIIGYHGLFFLSSGLGIVGCFLAFLFKEPKH